MGFCTKCGRPRAGDTRFCTGCGAEFADDAPDTQPHPATQLADKPSSRGDLPDQEYPETQAVSKQSFTDPAPAEPDHPETQLAARPSWETPAEQEFPNTETLAKPSSW